MPALAFSADKVFVLQMAGTLHNILPTTSSHETQDRWESLQEALRMCATAENDVKARCRLSKLALVLFAAWQVEGGLVPSFLSVTAEGQIEMTCHVPEDGFELHRLQEAAALHRDEMEAGARDLAVLARHVKEAGFEKEAENMVEAQQDLLSLADYLHDVGASTDA